MENKCSEPRVAAGATRQAQRLIKAALRSTEEYTGDSGAMIAGLLHKGRVFAGMYSGKEAQGIDLSHLIGCVVHAMNTCLEEGGYQYRYTVKLVHLDQET